MNKLNNKWIKVEDRLPEIWEEVLLYKKENLNSIVLGYIHTDLTNWTVNGVTGGSVEMRKKRRPTHWMPLPEPPIKEFE